jgi:hypothetical protein
MMFATRSVLSAAVLVILFALSAPSIVNAQVLYGSVTGTVTDATGAAVPRAKIDVANVSTGIVHSVITDERGNWLINNLQPGTYKVTISAPSFGTLVEQGVELEANTVRRADAQLQLAQVNTTVSVDATVMTLQTDKSDVSNQIEAAQITNLPVSSTRNFQSLFKILPGFTPPYASHSEAGNPQGALGMNVNGASYNNNATRLDGALATYPWLPETAAYVPPEDSIQTVNVVTASFDAEQGMAGGAAVNVVIKSGTNDFHGSLWEYNTNSDLKARNYFYYGARNPKFILNQFGAAVGGPIKKNKLFFFADWERTLKRQNVNNFETVPTDALKQGNFAGTGAIIFDPATGNADGAGRTAFPGNVIPGNRFASAAAKMAALIPAPNQSTVSVSPTNDYFAAGSYANTRDNIDAKVNYNPTEKLAVFGRYSISPTNIVDPQALGQAGGPAIDNGQPGTAPGRVQAAGVGATYTVSPRILIDGNVAFTRLRLGAQNVDIDKNYGLDVLGIPGTNGPDRLDGGYPAFDFAAAIGAGNAATAGAFTNLGNQNNSNPFLFRDNEYVAAVNLGWVKGAHSMRFGGEYQHFGINHFQPQTSYGPRGGFTFNGGLTVLNGGAAPTIYNGWADFLLGQAQQLGTAVQNINPAAVRESSYAFYARDQWQVSRKVTINYGVRYEYYPFASRDNFGGDVYDPATNLVSLGGLNGVPFNSGVDVGKGQVAPRLGIAWRIDEKTVLRAGYGISVDPNSFRAMRDAYPAIIALSVTGATSFQAAGTLTTGIPAVARPDITKGTLVLPGNIATTTFKKDFNRGYIESFNFTAQREFAARFNLQAAYVGTRAIRHTDQVNVNAAGPGGGNSGRALFPLTGRTTDITEIMPFNTAKYDALQTQLTRRVGAGIFGVSYTFSKAIDYGDNDDSGLTWAWVPMYGRNRALAGFDRTHNFQAYTNYELPFGHGKPWASQGVAAAIAGGWQFNSILSRTSGTPFNVASSGTSVNAPGNTQTADQILPAVKILGGHGPGQPYFDPNAFAPVTAVRFGTSGRDILRGPGLFNTDISLFRNFALTERFKLQFRAEAFNFTNTPQFANPGATVSSATRNPDGSFKAFNGYTEITSASGERQLRFALRLSF